MDRAPQPGMPEEPAEEAEGLRRRRLLNRLRGFLGSQEEPKELSLSNDSEQEDHPDELWSREEEVNEDIVPRVQQLGRGVLEQTRVVQGFAESLSEAVDEMPAESRAHVKPEAERLKEATGDLQGAAEELSDELEGAASVAADHEPYTAESYEPLPSVSDTVEFEKPKKDTSEATGMARLVIATLIGGGLGALVGEGRKKDKVAVKEKVRMTGVIEQQKAKMAEQEAELQLLKQAKAEAGEPKKEIIQKATELTEHQTELTHATVEQVRVATKQAPETETTFRIPERQAEVRTVVSQPERVAENVENAEKLREQPDQKRDERGQETARTEQITLPRLETQQPVQNVPSEFRPSEPYQPAKLSSQTWVFAVLLAVATVIAVGLIIFGPR